MKTSLIRGVFGLSLILALASPSPGLTNLVAWGSDAVCAIPPGPVSAVAAASGGWHALAVRENGTVEAWGDNSVGQTNVPAGLSQVRNVAAGGSFSLALRQNGTVAAWGDNDYNQLDVPPGLSNAIAISARGSHSLALRSDGTVAAWGSNNDHQLDVPAGLRNVTAVAAGADFSMALLADGTLRAWGNNGFFQCDTPPEVSNVVDVAVGECHVLALMADGTVAAWGYSTYHQLDIPPGLGPVVAIGAGNNHCLALKPNGSAISWGYAEYGLALVPDSTNVASLSGGNRHSLALLGTGKPVLQPLVKRIGTTLGKKVFLSVKTVGQFPIHYQWFRNNARLKGRTGPRLMLTGATTNVFASYRCVAANALGTVTSTTVKVTYPAGVCLNAKSYATAEGATLAIKVKRLYDFSGPMRVTLCLIPKTAEGGKDYAPYTGRLSWTNGETRAKTVLVRIPADGKREGLESFQILLKTPVNASLEAPYTATATIAANTKVGSGN